MIGAPPPPPHRSERKEPSPPHRSGRKELTRYLLARGERRRRMAKNCVFSKLSEKSPAKVWSCEILIVPLHPQIRKVPSATTHGVLVQLVRMPACHAGGHEFESRTHRKKHPQKGCFFVLYIVYQLGKQLDQINYRKWNYQKSQKGGSKMEPPFATIGFDLLIMIDSYYFSIATTPGSTLPSMASNMAPPPVET